MLSGLSKTGSYGCHPSTWRSPTAASGLKAQLQSPPLGARGLSAGLPATSQFLPLFLVEQAVESAQFYGPDGWFQDDRRKTSLLPLFSQLTSGTAGGVITVACVYLIHNTQPLSSYTSANGKIKCVSVHRPAPERPRNCTHAS